MKTLKLSLLASLLAASGFAHATYCADGSLIESHPNNDCSAKPPKQHGSKGGDLTAAVGIGTGGDADAAARAAAEAAAAANAAAVGVKGNVSPVANGTGVQGDINATGKGGSARQGQQQGQGQGQTLDSRNQSSSGVTIEGAQAGSGSSYRYTAWVPMGLSVAASAVPSATTMPVVRRCDARVRVYEEAVTGYITGPFGGLKEVTLGYRSKIGPWLDWDGNPARDAFELVNVYQKDAFGAFVLDRDGAPIIIEQRLMGTEVLGGMTVLSTSSGASIVANLLVKDSGAAGGVGSSSGLQQQGQVLNAFPCVYAIRTVTVARAEPPKATPAPRPAKPRARRAAPAPKPCPVCCIPAAALVCPTPAVKPGA